jgi:hypothetical protein
MQSLSIRSRCRCLHSSTYYSKWGYYPGPFDVATCIYYTGIDPFTKKQVYVARHLKDRKMQRALTQFFKSENYFLVREALIQAGCSDLIGSGCDCLMPAQPPRVALVARRKQANQAARGEFVHQFLNHVKIRRVYRPRRKTARRQERN